MEVLHDDVRPMPPALASRRTGQNFCVVRLDGGQTAGAVTEAARAGFDTILAFATSPPDPASVGGDAALKALVTAGRDQEMAVWAMLGMDEIDSTALVEAGLPGEAFGPPPLAASQIADPRRPFARTAGNVRLRRPELAALIGWWRGRLAQLGALGVQGVALLDAGAAAWRLLESANAGALQTRLFASARDGEVCARNVYVRDLSSLSPAGEIEVLADVAMHSSCWAFEAPGIGKLSPAVRALNGLMRGRLESADARLRIWTGPGAALEITSRDAGGTALVRVRNHGAASATWPAAFVPAMPWQRFTPVTALGAPELRAQDGWLAPGEVVLLEARETPPVTVKLGLSARDAAAPAARVVIGAISPSVDQGVFAVKTIIGHAIEVRADIFTDGHEQIAACVLTRAADEQEWTHHTMVAEPNDVWAATIRLHRLGRHIMQVQGWIDEWGGFVRDFRRKLAAGQDLGLEILEARNMIAAGLAHAASPQVPILQAALVGLAEGTQAAQAEFLLDKDLANAMAAADERRFLATSFAQPIQVEREAAQFSSWYELFPRSQGGTDARHGSLRDVIARLPAVAAMGFDTLYFPPIHPIGERNRKGPNNAPQAAPGDHGSPYAIGSRQGGHQDIHPELGTLQDFRDLRAAAAAQGLEIALDFAIQCAPDHPWLSQHKDWFAWRPDGSMKYAENPPKKYQDIVNVDFYAEAAIPDLWDALRDIVLFWAAEGVRVFRVDNPHTKPLPFWSWMIGEVQARHPDVIFLSEAFTRPKPMYQLAKAGFSQSYSYFTWRNDKPALTAYLTELTQTPVRDHFRPHFFVNTPDINPFFLQTSGRAGFLIRAALAATLSGLWGVYSGFELCESAALEGREEYLDSEKYQLRPRPARMAGDIVDEITQLNQLRRAEPALQSHLGVSFHNAYNDQIIYYSKSAPGHADRILVAVSLDPFRAQETQLEIPLWLFDLEDWQSVDAGDLLTGHNFQWTGKMQHIRLTPEQPYGIWRIAAPRAA